ncbi:MAG: fumarate hydratase [Candidatus Methanoplasma sp.]|jgi:fumarate hydratase subunit alpha|nr:fumarate hydratase [Candidatus Methanoplasma sp.]
MIKLPEPMEQIVFNLLKLANTRLPPDVGWALEAAAAWETNGRAAAQLGAILDNVKQAELLGRPMCQDTGIPVFYVRGEIPPSIREDISAGLARATAEIPLRPNTVDPLTRESRGDNLGAGMPVIHYFPEACGFTEVSVMLKGAGTENMARLGMLNPSEGVEGVKRFVAGVVLDAGGRPCPPGIVGVGIGGTADGCMAMAKEVTMSSGENPDPALKALEEELFVALNGSGLGPMGLGGDSTVLAVRIKAAHCHTASLPVAVNVGCWATRRASVRLSGGRAEYSQEASL